MILDSNTITSEQSLMRLSAISEKASVLSEEQSLTSLSILKRAIIADTPSTQALVESVKIL